MKRSRVNILASASAACFMLLLQMPLVGQEDYFLAGRVTNVLTENPVKNVGVVVGAASSVVATTTTDITGYFEVANLPNEGPYQIEFRRRGYRSAYITSISASVININIALEPHEIPRPPAPEANAGPKNVYVDWPALPAVTIKGYNLYRTETDVTGLPTGETIKLNGLPEVLRGDLLESASYIDADTVQGKYYVYQVQAVSNADRLSALSEPSLVVKAKHLTLFIPTVYAPQLRGISFLHPVSGNLLARIPVAVESAFDVIAQGLTLAVDLPADAFLYDENNSIIVMASGLTRQLAFNVRTEIVGDVIRIFIEADEAVALYGSGALFNILAVPANVAEDECVPIKLHTDASYIPVQTDDGLVPVELEVLDGLYCNASDCIYGDITNDGRVDVADAGALLRYLVGKLAAPTGHPCFPTAADINYDDRVDVADVRLILRYITHDMDPPAVAISPSASTSAPLHLKADTEYEAVVSLLTETTDTNVVASIILEGVEDISGFSLSLGYPSDLLDFDSATTEDTLANEFTAEYENYIYGDDGDNGLVKISAVTQQPLVALEKTVIMKVQLAIADSTWEEDSLPIRIIDFSYSDAEGYTPRHTDPAAPKGYGQSLGQAAALFCTLMDKDALTPLTNGTISIAPPQHSPVSNNTNGVYAMPALDGGDYTITASASNYNNTIQNFYIGKGETVSRELYLELIPVEEGEAETEGEVVEGEQSEGEAEPAPEEEGEGESEGESEAKTKERRILFCGNTNNTAESKAGDLAVMAFVIIALIACSCKITSRKETTVHFDK